MCHCWRCLFQLGMLEVYTSVTMFFVGLYLTRLLHIHWETSLFLFFYYFYFLNYKYLLEIIFLAPNCYGCQIMRFCRWFIKFCLEHSLNLKILPIFAKCFSWRPQSLSDFSFLKYRQFLQKKRHKKHYFKNFITAGI